MHTIQFDWSTRLGLYCVLFLTVVFIARIYYYGWRLRVARDSGQGYRPLDLEAHRLSVIATVVFAGLLLVMIEWSMGQFAFLTDFLYLPRVVPARSHMGLPFLIVHVLVALATAAMFAIIALRMTGLRDRLRHRKLVYQCLGLMMLTGLMGSALLATFH